MQSFDIVKKVSFKDSFRNSSIIGQFDLSEENYTERFKGELSLKGKDWSIGLIVGTSGTGKTTIAKQLFGNEIMHEYPFKDENSLIDDMPENKTIKEITSTFNRVGFSTPLSWLKPYSVLSNGEKMRAKLAYEILIDKKIICFDEFTSVVDRNVAKVTSQCMQKAIRKTDKKFIAISCHFDIKEWLNPDWIFDTNTMEFFFIKNCQNYQKTNSKYMNVKEMNGECLGNITI